MTRAEELLKQKAFMKEHPECRKYRPSSFLTPKPHKKPVKKKHKNLTKVLRRFRRGLTKQATRHELLFRSMLKILDIKFEFQKIFVVNKKGYIADFYLKDYLMIIEIDGGSHNSQTQKDLVRSVNLLKLNSINHIVRFDNEDVENMNEIDLSRKLTLLICPFSELYW